MEAFEQQSRLVLHQGQHFKFFKKKVRLKHFHVGLTPSFFPSEDSGAERSFLNSSLLSAVLTNAPFV